MPALELVEQGGVSNHTEAALIHVLLSLLIKVLQLPDKINNSVTICDWKRVNK